MLHIYPRGQWSIQLKTTRTTAKYELVVQISETKQSESTQNTINNSEEAGTAARVLGQMQPHAERVSMCSVPATEGWRSGINFTV